MEDTKFRAQIMGEGAGRVTISAKFASEGALTNDVRRTRPAPASF